MSKHDMILLTIDHFLCSSGLELSRSIFEFGWMELDVGLGSLVISVAGSNDFKAEIELMILKQRSN